jgi:hypothetical protein
MVAAAESLPAVRVVLAVATLSKTSMATRPTVPARRTSTRCFTWVTFLSLGLG